MKPDLAKYDHLPRFPDGRIDYSDSRSAIGVNCIVTYKDELLLLKRSKEIGTAPEKWHVIAGYVDEEKPLRELALKELKEETGITEEHIKNMTAHAPITIHAVKEWTIYPFRVELKEKPDIVLDWEHTEYAWVTRDELDNYDTLMNLRKLLKTLKLQ